MNDINKDIQDFQKLHPHRKLAVFGIVLFVFVISILVGLYFTQIANKKGGVSSNNEANNIESSTTLSLVPSNDSITVGDLVTVSVMLDGEAVPATDVIIEYDPTFFAVADSNVTVGSAFKTLPYKKVENGKIIATAMVDLNNPKDVKTGEVVSITLEALKAGSSSLSFDVESEKDVQETVTSRIGGFNTLKSAQGTTITIK